MVKYFNQFKTLNILALSFIAFSFSFVSHSSFAGGFGNQMTAEGQNLYLNGQGPRKKAFLTIYETALYLTEKGQDATAILSADHPMAINIEIKSKLASAARITKAFHEGLEKSTGGNIAPIEAETKAFLSVFESGVVKNDVFSFLYLPGKGSLISKNGAMVKQIEGLAFKEALFGIWLSDDPISGKLKKQLLGQ